MKPSKLILLLILSGALSACSDDTPESNANTCNTLAGHYELALDPSTTLDIFNDCTFTDSFCGYDAEYSIPDLDGNSLVTVIDTNGAPGCMSSTVHACQIGFNGVELGIECDSGAHSFYFLKR